jgi:tRNA threonylcarbamoyladenosine biosynthesis protein TsaE
MIEPFFIQDETQLAEVAQAIKKLCTTYRHFLLDGPMGAGKTTLMRYIADAFGAEDPVSSPTFSIINAYFFREKHPADTSSIIHMDLYRIEDPKELIEIGFDEYLYSDAPVFIEWPAIAEAYYDENACVIRIDFLADNHRKIRIFPFQTTDRPPWVTK